jgi:hypothetical protein
MKRAKWFVLAGAVVALFQGCATADKPLTVKNMQTITSIKVVRTGPPGYLKKTIASEAVAYTGMMFGAIGGGLGGGISYAMEVESGKKLAEKCSLPDVNKLLEDRFVERLLADLPDCPKLEVAEVPVDKDYKNSSGYLLMVRGGAVNLSATAFGITVATS